MVSNDIVTDQHRIGLSQELDAVVGVTVRRAEFVKADRVALDDRAGAGLSNQDSVDRTAVDRISVTRGTDHGVRRTAGYKNAVIASIRDDVVRDGRVGGVPNQDPVEFAVCADIAIHENALRSVFD